MVALAPYREKEARREFKQSLGTLRLAGALATVRLCGHAVKYFPGGLQADLEVAISAAVRAGEGIVANTEGGIANTLGDMDPNPTTLLRLP